MAKGMNKLFSVFQGLRNDRVRSWKPDWVPGWAKLYKEIDVHPHCPEERAELFIGHNIGSTEVEVLNWLYATICLLKPHNILETGAAQGLGTIALASACRANGFGKVHTVEIEFDLCKELEKKLKRQRLLEYVEIYCKDSLDYLKDIDTVFDFAFFDSMCDIRVDEFSLMMERKIIKNIAIFHDTSAFRCVSLPDLPTKEKHDEYRSRIIELGQSGYCTGYYESNLSRGLIVLFIK